jgi:ElaB/YqjD/DUF883 family membrane-anchored ribosome-binding protein
MEEAMSNQSYSAGSSSSNRGEGVRGQEEGSEQSGGVAASIAGEASAHAKRLASDAAETVTQQTKHLLDNQLSAGADLIAALAGATRRASEDLEHQSPQIAKLVQSMADRAHSYSGQLREQSVEDLARSANRFVRQNPSLVFGLAALAGFFAWRVVKAAPQTAFRTSSPPIQPYSENQTRPGHGARKH